MLIGIIGLIGSGNLDGVWETDWILLVRRDDGWWFEAERRFSPSPTSLVPEDSGINFLHRAESRITYS